MYPDIDTIKGILLKQNYLSKEDSKTAEANAKDGAGYVDYLIREGILTKPLLGQALAEGMNLPYADLLAHPASKEQVLKIPETEARAYRAVIAKEQDKATLIASDTPEKVDIDKLGDLLKTKVQLAYTLPDYIDASFRLYEQPLETRFSQIISSGQRVAPEIVDEIIKDALTYRASDIHFEPEGENVTVRFRVDGNLREAGHMPKIYYDNVLNRIKIQSGMRIDEHQIAQDGALQYRQGEASADLRVSLVPTIQGEKVVMRVLGSYIQNYTLTDIGLDDKHRQMLENYATKPFGMILTVGPTGSGKTTTLYSLLKLLNKRNVNITTIEDPVEYKISGINQIQVHEQANMTFGKGLRAIVRQDPNIILVGEIRDNETAEISINAALTGHLLLSTFHANDAATAVPRLIDLGIEPFLLASTLEVVIAQRLARRICSQCRYSLSIKEALAALVHGAVEVAPFFRPSDTVYAGKGCTVCAGTGYDGRVALFEFIEVTPEMEQLILHSPSTQEIASLAHKQGALTMFEDGINKVKSGVTTIAEVTRVIEPPKKSKSHNES